MARSRCPICNGYENQSWFVGIEQKRGSDYAVFIVECWSGNTHQSKQPYHIYKKYVKIADKVEIDQLKALFIEKQEGDKAYEKEIKDLEKLIVPQEEEIESLKEQLSERDEKISQLTKQLDRKQESIDHLKSINDSKA